MKKDVTFDEIFEWLHAKIEMHTISLTLWSWRVQGASEQNLRDVERSYGKALDRLWEAQQCLGI
jgi:hypothetical protein